MCTVLSLSLTEPAFPLVMKQIAIFLVEHQKNELAHTGPFVGKIYAHQDSTMQDGVTNIACVDTLGREYGLDY